MAMAPATDLSSDHRHYFTANRSHAIHSIYVCNLLYQNWIKKYQYQQQHHQHQHQWPRSRVVLFVFSFLLFNYLIVFRLHAITFWRNCKSKMSVEQTDKRRSFQLIVWLLPEWMAALVGYLAWLDSPPSVALWQMCEFNENLWYFNLTRVS